MADPDLELRANRMDVVSRWADDLAHEIKNPLHAMVINLELVKRRAGLPDPEPLVQRAEIVEAELHRVHRLVESVLRLVRPWPRQLSCNVDRVFEELFPAVDARARVRRLRYEHRPGGGGVAMSPGPLALVLVNLLDAAINASPEGSAVVTESHSEHDGIVITVRDQRPERSAGRTPEPPSAAAEGAGLALAVAQRLIHNAGGTLVLRPEADGPGHAATVRLPRAGAA
jgi:signal transduction histidine kinase